MSQLDASAGASFFGPIEELGNVGLCFVVLQALRMLVGIAVQSWVPAKSGHNDKERKKVASYAWYSLYYTVVVVWGLWLFYVVKDWGWDMANVCRWEPIAQSVGTSPSLHLYHCVQVAFYLNYLFAMVTGIDVKRKDQWAFASHHIITIGLILFSRNMHYMQIQLATLVLHDVADPLLSIAKLIKSARPTWTLASDVFMVAFALVFFATRWVLYPLYFIANCRVDWQLKFPLDWSHLPTDKFLEANSSVLLVGGYVFSYYGMAMLLLYALYALHLWWGCFILFMAHRKFTGTGSGASATGDDNSDGEDSPPLAPSSEKKTQ